jgi:hypothetical protein
MLAVCTLLYTRGYSVTVKTHVRCRAYPVGLLNSGDPRSNKFVVRNGYAIGSIITNECYELFIPVRWIYIVKAAVRVVLAQRRIKEHASQFI